MKEKKSVGATQRRDEREKAAKHSRPEKGEAAADTGSTFDGLLDTGLEGTFPASDPLSSLSVS